MKYPILGFTERLQKVMFTKDCSVGKLSKMTQIPTSVLWGYWHGDNLPGARNLAKICVALCVSADYLLGIDEKGARENG